MTFGQPHGYIFEHVRLRHGKHGPTARPILGTGILHGNPLFHDTSLFVESGINMGQSNIAESWTTVK